MRYYLLLLFIFAGTAPCLAQTIQGKVTDKDTGEGIPFVSVGVVGTNTATITNDAGEFVFKNVSMPAKIRYSHVSYLPLEDEMKITSENLVIELQAASISLQPVVIDPNRGKRLLKSALELVTKYEDRKFYGKAFYRQLTALNGNASQIYELFYDVEFNVSKVNGWIAKQSRFAELNEGVAFAMNNQSYLTFSLAGSLIAQSKSGKFITLKSLNDFEISVDKYITQKDQDIAVVSCKFKGNKKQHYINSTYYVGITDFKIYRLEHSIFNLPMRVSGSTSKIPPIATTIATFNGTKTPIPILESISTKLYLNLTVNGSKLNPIVSSMLSMYHLDNNLNTQKFTELTKKVQDKAVVESIEYNPTFWKDNAVVKQTALENNFIKMMESKSAFGTMITPQ